ncbi:MAG: nicotinate-nucleotide--dimethylbenzimidazole phosphoribosyltransferase [Candidatus Omnitrophota bacterium]
MEKLDRVRRSIGALDRAVMAKTQSRLDNLTKPLGSLGRLEELIKSITGMTGSETPPLANKVIFTMAGDHGVTDEGVSPYPKAVTAQMVYNFLRGGAAINVLARHAGARVVVVDMGVAEDIKAGAGLIIRKINYGTRNMVKGPSMTRAEALKAIGSGIDIFESEFKKGIDIVCTGEMGIGNTTAASAITALFTGRPVKEVTGRGAGLDDKALAGKIRIVEKALDVNRPDPEDAIDVLMKVGGFEIGGLAGIILAASARRVPVVIDGFISGAAALVAYKLHPTVKDYMIASHCSVESGHKFILAELGLKPVLDLDLRLGEGTGSALALCLIDASAKILSEMATFESASVSKKVS